MSENKKCWACKRTLIGNSKLGLCPDCVNKYGSPVAAASVLGMFYCGKQLIKHGDKVVKVVKTLVKL